MHLGSFDDEPATVALMDEYLKQNRYANDMNSQRLHHEIYLSDARKVAPEKWKTVIRHPIRKIQINQKLWWGVNMLDKKEFDLWADGYDKTVGISDEKQISFCWLQKGTWIHFSDYNEN